MSAAQSRSRATVSLPLKVKGSTGYFVIDMKGEFKNIPLFDATVGLKRILSKWLKPHHSLSCVVIVASRVINNSILFPPQELLDTFFFMQMLPWSFAFINWLFHPHDNVVASLRVHSPLVNKLYRNIIKPPQIHQQPQYHLCSVGCGGNGNWRKIAIDTFFFCIWSHDTQPFIVEYYTVLYIHRRKEGSKGQSAVI